MIITQHTKELKAILSNKQTIGFVPTMGALHRGHLSLIDQAKKENQCVVCSIFVNPTQFNDKKDLRSYPRPLEKDQQLLEKYKCDILFVPTEDEVYPIGLSTPKVDLNGLDQKMEGVSRPGHFKGVVQVVHRLLDMVRPHNLYMGQKDYQQFCIIRHMINELSLPTKIHMHPIVREEDGLAMSSRNIRLSHAGRIQSNYLHKSLQLLKNSIQFDNLSISLLKAKELLNAQNLNVEYLEVVDAFSLDRVKDMSHPNPIIACLVVKIDGVRLLDNMIIKE